MGAYTLEPNILSIKEFNRPLPVDNIFSNGGVHSRSHIGSFTFHRGDWELIDYRRTEWYVVRKKFRQLLMRTLFSSSSSQVSFTGFEDETNTTRSLICATNSSVAETWHSDLANKIKFGSGTTSPTETDYNIQTQLGSDITSLTVTDDTTNLKTTVSGSQQNTSGSTWSINEVAFFRKMLGSASWFFLTDRSSLSPTLEIANNETVSIVYEWQF